MQVDSDAKRKYLEFYDLAEPLIQKLVELVPSPDHRRIIQNATYAGELTIALEELAAWLRLEHIPIEAADQETFFRVAEMVGPKATFKDDVRQFVVRDRGE